MSSKVLTAIGLLVENGVQLVHLFNEETTTNLTHGFRFRLEEEGKEEGNKHQSVEKEISKY